MKSQAMAALDVLVGAWDLTLTNSWFLESMETRLTGRATFEWLDDAFLVWRWFAGDENEPGEFVIGRNDAREAYTALSRDYRGVSRVFGMTWGDGEWTLLREDPDFHQRLEATVEPDRITMRVDASEDAGQTWRKDFDLTFERRP